LEIVERRVILIQISNSILAALWISSIEERDRNVGLLIFIYVLTFNLLFLFWWIQKYQPHFISKIRSVRVSLKEKLKFKSISLLVANPSEASKRLNSGLDSVEFLLEKYSKLKILNSLLLMRLEELERMEKISPLSWNNERNIEDDIIDEEVQYPEC
jgi:hypothetical protein